METRQSNPLPDGILVVALAMAVGASIFLGQVLLTLFRGMELYPRAVDLAVESSGCLLLGSLAGGLLCRKKWAWGASLAVCGLLTLLVFVLGIELAVTLATEGLGRPHGVTAAGQGCLCILLPVALVIFGLPMILLWRDRRLL